LNSDSAKFGSFLVAGLHQGCGSKKPGWQRDERAEMAFRTRQWARERTDGGAISSGSQHGPAGTIRGEVLDGKVRPMARSIMTELSMVFFPVSRVNLLELLG
jgi:hypothetical protein